VPTSLPWTCLLFRLLASAYSMSSSSSGWRVESLSGSTSQQVGTAKWIARQITEAFPWDEAPRYLIRDRDKIYGAAVTRRMRAMGIRDKPIVPASPWQNGVAERLIGSTRRECVDHIVALGEGHLCRARKGTRATIISLDKDAPVHRPIESLGAIISRPVLGGPHHQYCRI
jgi:hypothetical protein